MGIWKVLLCTQACKVLQSYTLPASFESLVLHSPGHQGIDVDDRIKEERGAPGGQSVCSVQASTDAA